MRGGDDEDEDHLNLVGCCERGVVAVAFLFFLIAVLLLVDWLLCWVGHWRSGWWLEKVPLFDLLKQSEALE